MFVFQQWRRKNLHLADLMTLPPTSIAILLTAGLIFLLTAVVVGLRQRGAKPMSPSVPLPSAPNAAPPAPAPTTSTGTEVIAYPARSPDSTAVIVPVNPDPDRTTQFVRGTEPTPGSTALLPHDDDSAPTQLRPRTEIAEDASTVAILRAALPTTDDARTVAIPRATVPRSEAAGTAIFERKRLPDGDSP